MNTTQNLQIRDQIQTLASKDLIQLRAFIDDLIRKQRISREAKVTVMPHQGILSDIKPIGIPGPKVPFDRNMIMS
jgi:hypothetical protein